MPDGPPEPLGQLAAAVLAADRPAAISWARRAGLLASHTLVETPSLIELLQPLVASAANDSFTYSPAWMRALMSHLTEPRFRALGTS